MTAIFHRRRAPCTRRMARGVEFLGSEVAILCGAMSWVSRAQSRRRDLQRRRVRADRVRGDDAGIARCRDRRDQGADDQAVRREPDHDAPDAVRADRGVREASGHACRARRRVAAQGVARGDQGDRRQGDLLRPRAEPCQETDPLGRRRAGGRGDGGRRAYRPGVDQRARAGNPARGRRAGAGVRRRRDRPRRGDQRLSRHGRGGRPARHALRLRDRKHRASQFQEGVLPRLRARRGVERPDRPAPAGHPGPRAQECRRRIVHRQAARGRATARRGQGRDDGGAAPDRALLGGRAAPRGDRRRCRAWQR